jgi:hypothetical protein
LFCSNQFIGGVVFGAHATNECVFQWRRGAVARKNLQFYCRGAVFAHRVRNVSTFIGFHIA